MVSGGERIPKRKPDNTTVVRFELQDTERAMLESFLMTWQVAKLADSVDKLVSLENAYLLVTLIEIATGKEIFPGTPNDIYQLLDWVRDEAKEGGMLQDWWEAGTGEDSPVGWFIRAYSGTFGAVDWGRTGV